MSHYVLIQSKSPWESDSEGRTFSLVRDLADAGHRVTLFLVQNGVLATRSGSNGIDYGELTDSNVRILADDFSLRERGIHTEAIKRGVNVGQIGDLVDLIASGTKTIWC